MKPLRFSPIKDKAQLFKVIEYIHFESYKLCKQKLGYYLPVAGNLGVFCHFDDEYVMLTAIRKELTDESDNWNQKYFRLYKPIIIPTNKQIPETTYTYLYIRRPEVSHPEVGDVDFYLQPSKYHELKQALLVGKTINNVKIFERPDLDLIEISDPNCDVCAFVGRKTMFENISGEN